MDLSDAGTTGVLRQSSVKSAGRNGNNCSDVGRVKYNACLEVCCEANPSPPQSRRHTPHLPPLQT